MHISNGSELNILEDFDADQHWHGISPLGARSTFRPDPAFDAISPEAARQIEELGEFSSWTNTRGVLFSSV